MNPVDGSVSTNASSVGGGFKVSVAAKVALAVLTTLSVVGVAISAVLFFHMAIPVAFVALIVTAATAGLFLAMIGYMSIERFLPKFMRFPVDLVTSVVKELFFVPILLGTMAGQGIFGKKEEKPDGSGELVLMVHGYMGTSAHFSYLKYRLEKEGVGSIYTMDLGNPLLSIDDYAEMVKLKVREIRQKHPGKKVTLVGHSMGGVVISRYTGKCKNSDHLEQVITLGSPLQGAYATVLMPGKCAEEMRHDSKYLRHIEKRLQNKTVPFVNVGSTTDLIIIPNNATTFKSHPSEKITLPGMGHASYLYSDEVAALLASKIKGA